jgi:WS/DGAT/MGAT family acyltransferase
MSKAERMSSVDTTWLRMDRPANPMVVVGLLILEGPLDLNKLEETITQRFLAIPRFRQRVENRGGEHWWVDDPYFDESRHIRRVRLPGMADQRELQRYVAELASEHLDKARPLWQMHIVEDYQGGAAIVIRIHHAVGDGMALVGLMLSVMDGGDQRAWTAHSDAEPPAWLSLPGIKALQKSLGITTDLLKEATALAANPAKTAKIGAGVAGELAWLLLMPEDSWTRFKGKPSGNKRVAWTDPIPLHEVKAVGKALGCTINDVLLASVAGALCQYLKDKGDPVKGVEIRALVPVDMRKSYEAGQLGNKFGIVGVELPVGIESPLMRVYEVHRRMQALKQSLEPPVTLGMFAVLGYAPQMLQDRLFNMLIHRATAVMTNVPGPQSPLHMGGAEIKQVMFWVPQSGDIGMGVSILSFNGIVQFGLITDAQMVPDPEAIIAHFTPQFEELLYYVLMAPWGEADVEAADNAAQQSAAEAPVTRSHKSRSASRSRLKGDQEISAASPEPDTEAPVAEARKSRPTPKPRSKSTQPKSGSRAISPVPAEPDTEVPVAEARKSRPAPKPRAKSPVAPEPKTEAPVPQARKSRPASQPRTRGSQGKTGTQALPQAAPEPRSAARRKLPRK